MSQLTQKQKIRAQGSHQRESPVPGRFTWCLGPMPKLMEGKAVPYYLGEAGLELGEKTTSPPMRRGTPEAPLEMER